MDGWLVVYGVVGGDNIKRWQGEKKKKSLDEWFYKYYAIRHYLQATSVGNYRQASSKTVQH